MGLGSSLKKVVKSASPISALGVGGGLSFLGGKKVLGSLTQNPSAPQPQGQPAFAPVDPNAPGRRLPMQWAMGQIPQGISQQRFGQPMGAVNPQQTNPLFTGNPFQMPWGNQRTQLGMPMMNPYLGATTGFPARFSVGRIPGTRTFW